MRDDEGIDVARGGGVVAGRRGKEGRRRLPVAPRIRMDARPLFVGLIEDRRHLHRAAEAGPLAAVVAADVATILHDQFRARREAVSRIIRLKIRMAVAGSE